MGALLAQMVSLGLDAERSTSYCDLVLHSLPEAARRALRAMYASKYEYQSEFARRYFGQGKAAGVAEIVLELLATRFGALCPAVGRSGCPEVPAVRIRIESPSGYRRPKPSMRRSEWRPAADEGSLRAPSGSSVKPLTPQQLVRLR
jgi:hypothetical protein